MIPRISNLLSCLVVAVFVAVASKASATVLQVGNPYTLPGSTGFQIFALQGIDASSPLGKTGFNPQVNRNFEFPDSIGVSYEKNGALTNFGLGLYSNAQGQVQSTGLKIVYDNLVQASMVTVTLEDFDIQAGKATFFNPQKVEPSVVLLGPGGSIFASAKPTDIFSALVPVAGPLKGDTWNLNLGALLSNLHLSDGQISVFILSADALNGEQPNSDPYLLVSVTSNCTPVPEPANYAVGLAGIAFAGFFQMRQVRARRKVAVNNIR